jgi:uncharacterized membrane protein YfcA
VEMFIFAGLIALSAAFIHGSIGLGFPIVATPLLALVTDLQTAIIVTLIPNLLINLISIKSEGSILTAFRRYLPLALMVLIWTHSEIFKALLAITIIVYLLAERIRLNLSWVREHRNAARVVFGISAGILGGLTNVMAPVLIIYSLESKYGKGDTIQLLNFCFLSGKMIQLIVFAVDGRYTGIELSISSFMLFVASFSLYGGILIKKRIRTDLYKKILKGVLLILAAILLIQVSM